MKDESAFEIAKAFVAGSISLTGDFVPVIGGIMNFVYHQRFTRRLNKHEQRIKHIFSLIPAKDMEFMCDKIGVHVLEKVMKDEEDDKAEFLLLGFENCVTKEIKDQELVIYYFDLLSDLRMVDLKRLVSIVDNDVIDITKIKENDLKNIIIRASDEKLRQKGLIEANISWSSGSGEAIRYDNPDFRLTQKGLSFMNFLGY